MSVHRCCATAEILQIIFCVMVNLFSTVLGFAAFFKSREDQTIRIDNVGWGTSLTSSNKL